MSSAAPATEKYPLSLLSATLVKSQPLSPDVRLLTLQVEGDSCLEFLAGQSVRVEQELNEKPVPLVYSIASPPGGNCIQLCVKPGRKGSPADHLCALQVGSQVRISRPQGGFVLQLPEATTLFLAAGTGIAPIRSMIHWLVRNNDRRPLWLIFGARDTGSLFFHSEFLDLAERHPNFRYVPVLSRSPEGWNGARGYVQHHLDGIPRQAARAYLCGPPAMVKSVSRSLGELGWPENLIHYERNGY
jgi:phenol hydroxylase P5 protein